MRSVQVIAFALLLAASQPALAQPYVELQKSAEQKLKSGQYEQAGQDFAVALKSASDLSGVNPAVRARIAAGYARVLLVQGDLANAKLRAEQARISQPDDATRLLAVLVLAGVHRAKAEFRDAREKYDSGLAETKERGLDPLRAGFLLGRGELARLEAHFDQAYVDLTAAAGLFANDPGAAERLDVAAAIADLLLDREMDAQADAKYREIIKAAGSPGKRLHPPLARAYLGLAMIALREGRNDLVKTNVEQAAFVCGEGGLIGVTDVETRWFLADKNKRAPERARILYEQAKDLSAKHPLAARALVDEALATPGAPDSLKKLQEAEAMQRDVLGSAHPALAFTLKTIGATLRRNRNYPESAQRLTEAERIERAALGDNSLALAETLIERAALFVDEGQNADAEAKYREALRIITNRLPAADHPTRRETSLRFGLALAANGKSAEAGPLLEAWWKAQGTKLPATDPDVFPVRLALAASHLEAKQYAVAADNYSDLLKNFRDAAVKQSKFNAIELGLGNAHYLQDHFADAIPHYEAALSNQGNQPAAVEFWERFANSYLRVGQPGKAADALKQVLASRIGQKAPTAEIRLLLADSLLEAGRLDEAQPYLLEWMSNASDAARKSVLIAKILARLGAAAADQLKAEPLIRAMLAEVDRPGGVADATLSVLLAMLANVRASQGRASEAADLYERCARRELALRRTASAQQYLLRARQLREKDSGTSTKTRAQTLQSLAQTYILQRKYDAAEPLLNDAKALIEKSDPPDPLQSAATINGLGEIAQARAASANAAGDGARAQELFKVAGENFETAAKSLEKVPDAPRAVRAAVLFNQGSLAFSNGRPMNETAQYFKQCLDLAKQAVGREDPPPLEQLDGIAQFYVRDKHFDDAAELLKESLELRRATFGEASAEYGWGLQAMADFQVSRSQYDKGIENGNRALQVFERQAGSDSEEVATILSLLANAYHLSKDEPRAIQSQENALRIRRKSGQIGRDQEQMYLAELGAYHRGQRNWSKALEVSERQRQLWEPSGPADPNYLMALRNLAVALEYTNDHDRSQEIFKKLRPVLKGQKSDEIKLLEEYADALAFTGHTKDADKLRREAKNLGGTKR